MYGLLYEKHGFFCGRGAAVGAGRYAEMEKILHSGVEILHTCNYIVVMGAGGCAGEARPLRRSSARCGGAEFFCPSRCTCAIFMKQERNRMMNAMTALPPEATAGWNEVFGWLRLARAVRAFPAGEKNGDFSGISPRGVDNRRNVVSVRNRRSRKSKCATSTKRSGGSSR